MDERGVYGPRLGVAIGLVTVLGLLLWFVRGMLGPFVIAVAIAALLDPALDKLRARGLPRIWSVTIVYALFFIVAGGFVAWLGPIIRDEAIHLAAKWPSYLNSFKDWWASFAASDLVNWLRLPVPQNWAEMSERMSGYMSSRWQEALSGAGALIAGTVGYLLNTVIVLIATFYLLNDWPRLRRRLHYVIPPQYRENVVDIIERVGAVFAAYLRGLLTLCLLYGASVTIGLLILGIEYPFILGLVAALLYAVPYIGAMLLALIVGIVALVGPGGVWPAVIAITVILGLNQLFDSILTPKILGRSTGLHPLLSLFAILAGSELFGIVGFILGVPVAASIAIIASALYPRLAEEIPDTALVPPEHAASPEAELASGGQTIIESAAEVGRQADQPSGRS